MSKTTYRVSIIRWLYNCPAIRIPRRYMTSTPRHQCNVSGNSGVSWPDDARCASFRGRSALPYCSARSGLSMHITEEAGRLEGSQFQNRQIPVSNQPSGEPQAPRYPVVEGLLVKLRIIWSSRFRTPDPKPRPWPFQWVATKRSQE